MTMVAEPEVVTVPTRPERTGVMGVNGRTTRTETTLPVVLLTQVAEAGAQAPVGALPGVSHRRYTLPAGMFANGVTIRLAAARTWVLSVFALLGQTGPPPLPHPGSDEPIQLASTEASRAPSRAAWDRTLFW